MKVEIGVGNGDEERGEGREVDGDRGRGEVSEVALATGKEFERPDFRLTSTSILFPSEFISKFCFAEVLGIYLGIGIGSGTRAFV